MTHPNAIASRVTIFTTVIGLKHPTPISIPSGSMGSGDGNGSDLQLNVGPCPSDGHIKGEKAMQDLTPTPEFLTLAIRCGTVAIRAATEVCDLEPIEIPPDVAAWIDAEWEATFGSAGQVLQ